MCSEKQMAAIEGSTGVLKLVKHLLKSKMLRHLLSIFVTQIAIQYADIVEQWRDAGMRQCHCLLVPVLFTPHCNIGLGVGLGLG